MEKSNIRIAITHGDTNGIGYELIFKTFATPEMLELCTPIIYGSPKLAAYHRKALDVDAAFSIINSVDDVREGRLNLITCFDEEVKVELGTPTADSAKAAELALKRAVGDMGKGGYDALVLAPAAANDEVKRQGLVALTGGGLRIAIATAADALSDIPAKITKENVIKQAETFAGMLRRDLRVAIPRIAVLALNPSAEGREEDKAIAPAIESLSASGIQAFGPYAAGEFFGTGQYDAFDGILAMYYDQGAVAFRAIAPDGGIMCVAGLDVPCTMVSDAACYQQAGKGVADETQFRQAIYAAIDICRNRADYDAPMGNPLPKLFHEKREEGERTRFSARKKQVETAAEEREDTSLNTSEGGELRDE